jgi:hypothetical protein
MTFPSDLLARFANVKPRRGKADTWDFSCPVHEDERPSATLKLVDGKALVNCMVCCHQMDRAEFFKRLNEIIGTKPADWFAEGNRSNRKPARRIHDMIEDIYPYTDRNGKIIMEVCRILRDGKKSFAARRPRRDDEPAAPTEDKKYVWERTSVDVGGDALLYRLPEIVKAHIDEPIVICEGEKDADSAAAIGFIATTNPFGAGCWETPHCKLMAGRKILICEDNDDAGRTRTGRILGPLIQAEIKAFRILRFTHMPEHADLTDFLYQSIGMKPPTKYARFAAALDDESKKKAARNALIKLAADSKWWKEYIPPGQLGSTEPNEVVVKRYGKSSPEQGGRE